jgi:hypothetical protein
MSESDPDQAGHVVHCATVREVIERFNLMDAPYSLIVCAESETAAVLKLVGVDGGKTVTVVADASWLAALWRMCPGDRRPIRLAALTKALEAHARTKRDEGGSAAIGVLP